MKKKIFSRKIVIISAITAAFAVGMFGGSAAAAGSYQAFTPKSYGTFTYDDGDSSNNNGHDHDLMIDTSDISKLAENSDRLAETTDDLVKSAVKKTDIISTLEGIKTNANGEKIVSANVVKEFMQNFQDGVNKIYNKLVGLGFTPSSNSPDSISQAIQNIYDGRYNTGYNEGNNAGYNAGNNAGYNAGYNEGYSAGNNAGYNEGYSAGNNAGYNAGYNAGTKNPEMLEKISFYTWNIPDTAVPAHGTVTLTSPTAEEMFGTGAIFLGINYINAPVSPYGGIKVVSFSNFGSSTGSVSITFKNDSTDTQNIGSYASVSLMGYIP